MRSSTQQRQHGAVLMVCLVMLVLLTITGLAAVRTSIMESKMAANSFDHSLAFLAAESALRHGEMTLLTQLDQTPIPSFDGSSGIWSAESAIFTHLDWWRKDSTWWQTHAVPFTGLILEDSKVRSAPVSITELYGFIEDDLSVGGNQSNSGRIFYRITARGSGGSDQSGVITQSIYATRY